MIKIILEKEKNIHSSTFIQCIRLRLMYQHLNLIHSNANFRKKKKKKIVTCLNVHKEDYGKTQIRIKHVGFREAFLTNTVKSLR